MAIKTYCMKRQNQNRFSQLVASSDVHFNNAKEFYVLRIKFISGDLSKLFLEY